MLVRQCTAEGEDDFEILGEETAGIVGLLIKRLDIGERL
jgi:hypothetical protein